MTSKLSISFIAIGVLFITGLLLNSASAQTPNAQSLSTPPSDSLASHPISDSLAYAFFQNYHRSTSAAGSQAPLRNKGQAITQFYADQATLIEPLKAKARSLNKEFIGLSAIPAYNDIDSTFTLIWVAVVDADPGKGVTPELMLPDRGDNWTDYIYDFGPTCPNSCGLNSSQLWNRDWVR